MHEIRKNGAVLAMTESPNYIRLHPEGFYILCSRDEAQGVAVNGVPYALTDGGMGECESVLVVERDGGTLLALLQDQSNSTAKLAGQTAVAAKVTMQDSTSVADEQALQMPDMFRTWEEALEKGTELTAQTVLNKDGRLYRVVSAVTPQKHQQPGGEGMLAIYRPIDLAHTGTLEDPIPWEYGMDCENGLYYSCTGGVWLCESDMKPCTWAPGTAGIWQWEEVSE